VVDEFMRQWNAAPVLSASAGNAEQLHWSVRHGPNILVYPEGILYNNVTKADVTEIFDEHLLGGNPVERLKAPADIW